MQIFIERTKQNITKDFTGLAKDLLSELSISIEDVLIVRNGALVTENEDLTNEDSIRLLSVISGG